MGGGEEGKGKKDVKKEMGGGEEGTEKGIKEMGRKGRGIINSMLPNQAMLIYRGVKHQTNFSQDMDFNSWEPLVTQHCPSYS